jgi:hypothetical protein
MINCFTSDAFEIPDEFDEMLRKKYEFKNGSQYSTIPIEIAIITAITDNGVLMMAMQKLKTLRSL